MRVTDSDHNAGNRAQDIVYVDHLHIHSETQLGDPPPAPINLCAVSTGASRIDLSWTDNADGQYGLQIEPSLDGTDWSEIDGVGADAVSYAAPGVYVSYINGLLHSQN